MATRKITKEEFEQWRATFNINDVISLPPFKGATYLCGGCAGRFRAQIDQNRPTQGMPCSSHTMYAARSVSRETYTVYPVIS